MKHKPNLLALAAPAGLVLPEQLAQAADAVRELLAEAAAANTTRSYAAAPRYWAVGTRRASTWSLPVWSTLSSARARPVWAAIAVKRGERPIKKTAITRLCAASKSIRRVELKSTPVIQFHSRSFVRPGQPRGSMARP